VDDRRVGRLTSRNAAPGPPYEVVGVNRTTRCHGTAWHWRQQAVDTTPSEGLRSPPRVGRAELYSFVLLCSRGGSCLRHGGHPAVKGGAVSPSQLAGQGLHQRPRMGGRWHVPIRVRLPLHAVVTSTTAANECVQDSMGESWSSYPLAGQTCSNRRGVRSSSTESFGYGVRGSDDGAQGSVEV